MYDVYKIRKLFPMLQGKTMQGKPLVYLDTASTTFKPQCVIDAVSSYYTEMNANAHRGDYDLLYKMDCMIADTRKVVAKFTLKKVEKIYFGEDYWKATDEPINILEKACLSARDITRYLNGEGYAWHISDLVIFDEPKELSDFKHCTEKTCIYGKCHKYMHCLKTLTKAPQSWCYVEAML